MPLLKLGIVLTAVCWYFAWSHIGLVSEYSFFPLWVGYILLVNGLSEVMTGTSLLRRMRWSFLWLFVISIPMWWFFEYINTIVQNWHYVFAHQSAFFITKFKPRSTSRLSYQRSWRHRPSLSALKGTLTQHAVAIPGTALLIAFVSTFNLVLAAQSISV
jgi:hypothetical protein